MNSSLRVRRISLSRSTGDLSKLGLPRHSPGRLDSGLVFRTEQAALQGYVTCLHPRSDQDRLWCVLSGGRLQLFFSREDPLPLDDIDLTGCRISSHQDGRITVAKQGEPVAVFYSSDENDWSAALREVAEPHRLSLEGLNLEVAGSLDDDMNSKQPSDSRQQLLEEVLQTKELLQSKQKHKNSGGWTLTTAEVLNNSERAEVQVQMEAYREQVQLRQRKMSAALKAQPMQSRVVRTLSGAGGQPSGEQQRELEKRLSSLETSIRQSELSARQTVTQIRTRRQRQLRTMQDLGIPAAGLASESAVPGRLSSPSTPPANASSSWEETATLRRPRSLHSPSLTRRRTPLKIISALARNKRRSGADWEEAVADRPAGLTQLRSQVSAEALREIARFERLMEAFWSSRRVAVKRQLTLTGEHYL